MLIYSFGFCFHQIVLLIYMIKQIISKDILPSAFPAIGKGKKKKMNPPPKKNNNNKIKKKTSSISQLLRKRLRTVNLQGHNHSFCRYRSF